jgi:hypothetical protein
MPAISAEARRKIENLQHRFVYKSDKKVDSWRIMEEDKNGKFHGDCDDYATTVWWYVCDESLWKFWTGILVFKARFWYCLAGKNLQGHLILEYQDMFIDNWSRQWIEKDDVEHILKGYYRNNILMAALKMLLGKLFG